MSGNECMDHSVLSVCSEVEDAIVWCSALCVKVHDADTVLVVTAVCGLVGDDADTVLVVSG